MVENIAFLDTNQNIGVAPSFILDGKWRMKARPLSFFVGVSIEEVWRKQARLWNKKTETPNGNGARICELKREKNSYFYLHDKINVLFISSCINENSICHWARRKPAFSGVPGKLERAHYWTHYIQMPSGMTSCCQININAFSCSRPLFGRNAWQSI